MQGGRSVIRSFSQYVNEMRLRGRRMSDAGVEITVLGIWVNREKGDASLYPISALVAFRETSFAMLST